MEFLVRFLVPRNDKQDVKKKESVLKKNQTLLNLYFRKNYFKTLAAS